jgi:hypothetical protein
MEESEKATQPKNFNKVAYAAFVIAAIVFLFTDKDTSNTAIFLGVALVFDPFDINQQWGERPLWQKAWLIIHLGAAAAALGYLIGKDLL